MSTDTLMTDLVISHLRCSEKHEKNDNNQKRKHRAMQIRGTAWWLGCSDSNHHSDTGVILSSE